MSFDSPFLIPSSENEPPDCASLSHKDDRCPLATACRWPACSRMSAPAPSPATDKWDRRFLALAQHVATWSKDTTQVGCVIVSADRVVLAMGYNGLPRGVDDDVLARHERPEKYLWAEHAERNAIFSAARLGLGILKGATAYVNWCPCADCARALVQVGVARVVGYKPDDVPNARWADHFRVAMAMFEEADVEVVWLPRKGAPCPP